MAKVLTTREANRLMRAFYRLVHPDFFARYPAQQAVNERNLVVLRNWLELNQPQADGSGDGYATGFSSRSTPKTVHFYLHKQRAKHDADSEKQPSDDDDDELVEISARLSGGLFNWQQSFVALMRLAGLVDAGEASGAEADGPVGFSAWQPIEWDGTLEQFLRETVERARELRGARNELEQQLSRRRCMLYDHFGVRLHVRPRLAAFGELDLQSFLCSEEIERQVRLIDGLSALLGRQQQTLDWRDVTLCCSDDEQAERVDATARLHFADDERSWPQVFTGASLALVRQRQAQLHSRRAHEQALSAAYGFQSITASCADMQASDDYLDLLERLANAYHAGVRLPHQLGEPRLGLRVVPDEQYADELARQVDHQALAVPLSCDEQAFRRRCSDAYLLWRDVAAEKLEADREDSTMRYVQRATLLRHLWRHRSRVSRAEMIGCCVRLRGLCNDIGTNLFRGSELLVSDHMSVREDGVLVVKWNWQ